MPRLVINGSALANPHVGQGVYTLRLVQGLMRRLRSDDFVVVAPAGVERPEESREADFTTVRSFCSPPISLIKYLIDADRILRFARNTYPNAIFHSPGPIVGSAKPATTIVTLHDCLYRHFSNYNGRFRSRRTLSLAAERFAAGAQLVLTDSEFSRTDLINRASIPAKKLEVLYPWVGSEFLRPRESHAVDELRERLKLPARFWLYIGGYDFRKNVEFLLDAYAAARQRTDLPPLVLAGKVPTERNIATCDVVGALNRNRLTETEIILAGLIAAADLPLLFRAASLLVFPSLGEGFGLPPAEAIAVGTPVLSSNRMSLPEVVPNRDCLFDPCNTTALVEKLISAERDEKQFSSELSPHFTESYGINRYLELLDRVEEQHRD